jgi:hypothetical protein
VDGIAVNQVSSEETYRLRRLLVFYKKGLWVCLDEQFNDAVKLLANPNHDVAMPVDVEVFHQILEQAKQEPLGSLLIEKDKILNIVLLVVIAGLVTAVVAAVLAT